MYKNTSIVILIFISLLGSSLAICVADMPPFPGLPHEFWGTVKNQQGENITDGTVILAVIDDETYSTTVLNGIYGFNETYSPINPPFFIEDANSKNSGKTIRFYIGGKESAQTATFVNGGSTQLNFIVVRDNNNGQNSGGTHPEKIPPTAKINAPYSGTINRTITFDGSLSYDRDGTVVLYKWKFGDNSVGIGVSPMHKYANVGNYTVVLTVTDNDGLTDNDTTTVNITNDSDGDGWTDAEEEQYGTDPHNATDYPQDVDKDFLPDSVDVDSDNDGIADNEEIKLGSDPQNESDVIRITYQGNVFFFVDINGDGQSDKYYNKTGGFNTTLQKRDENGTFYVDTDNDGKWEYIYNAQDGSVSLFSGSQGEQSIDNRYVLYGFIVVVVVIVLLILFMFKKRLRGNRK